MQKQQVFKVKGMQRDASMANANGEFAYEILNMRLMPAEDLSGFSLTNEKGTTAVISDIKGQVIGQCPTNDSLVVFTTTATYNENDERTGGVDYIYEIYQDDQEGWTGVELYSGNLNFHVDKHIEALFNYETEDIQKVYWIDGINQLRCINIVESPENWGMVYNKNTNNWESGDNINNCYFDSVKEINSLPSVEIERVVGGSFTAGVIQYYITYFNKYSSESPIVYTSPLLYIAHDNRGANVNDQVSTAFKLTFADLDTTNWEYMRVYATHRTSIDATPEASIVTELNMDNSTIEFTDYGSNRTSIAPTDLYFTGGKFVKAGTMTVKDQVMFLGNINIESSNYLNITEIQDDLKLLFGKSNNPFDLSGKKIVSNNLTLQKDTFYYYKNNLNNISPITHYKYLERYRFGLSLQDKYGNWSNPIWIMDGDIPVPPTQSNKENLELPCPSLSLTTNVTIDNKVQTLKSYFIDHGVVAIRPLVVFPSIDERSVVAQGIVCPTVYNLQDRKSNSPYSQPSWFMRPNVPGDLWGFLKYNYIGEKVIVSHSPLSYSTESGSLQQVTVDSQYLYTSPTLWHKSDLLLPNWSSRNDPSVIYDFTLGGYFGASSSPELFIDDSIVFGSNKQYPAPALQYGHYIKYAPYSETQSVKINGTTEEIPVFGYFNNTASNTDKNTILDGSWLEFRHNYALRTKGWTFGAPTGRHLISQSESLKIPKKVFGNFNQLSQTATGPNVLGQPIIFSKHNETSEFIYNDSTISIGGARVAEISNTRFSTTIPVNRFSTTLAWGPLKKGEYNDGNNAYYVDNSIITLNSPEFELSSVLDSADFKDCDFRIIGMILLTSNVSDISLETSDPMLNVGAKQVGLHKLKVEHKNIGKEAFKSAVGNSGYYSPYGSKNNDYGYTILSPWQETGTLGSFRSTDVANYGSKELLVTKKLSNLRYSASNYFFGGNICLNKNGGSLDPIGNEDDNYVYNGHGWKPAKGCTISLFKNIENTSIIKLINTELTDDLVYRGNIDSVALSSANSNPATSYRYVAGKFRDDISYPLNELEHSPALTEVSLSSDAKGVGIKYKSSPHAVIAFHNFKESDITSSGNPSNLIQETLPIIYPFNKEGFSFNDTPESVNLLLTEDKSRTYENPFIRGIYHQSEILLLGTDDYPVEFIPNIDGLGSSYTKMTDISIQNPFGVAEFAYVPTYGWSWIGEIYKKTSPTFGGTSDYALQNNQWEIAGNVVPLSTDTEKLEWTQGDTYYQRFDTLKTYAYSDSDQNSVIDITSFMVETRINIDGRTDRNRGQESNLQMSPTNFNLMNDVYSQRDNFFTYRILDDDLQARTNFPNQITWSLTKTAGATVDAWMNITLASVLDLDGTKGKISALKNFNNNIIAFQEKGLSHIMFNSRAQIATSEAVPIQIANTGKVDGQQYFTTDVGCQDKWNIVTTPNGLYFVDYFNKSIYRFNGQLEDISTPNGFRSWCYENLNSTANILGYYDVKNKEVMYYIGDTGFMLDNSTRPGWLGFSELTGAFSSFYTYPKAWFANVQDQGLWLLSGDDTYTYVYTHQTGDYNELLKTDKSFYGLTIITRQDSNTVKTFNNVEFRADSYNGGILDDNHTFDTISAETEYQTRTPETLTYSQYRPSNLKKKFRTWRANIPRVNNGYNRFVNQWAKVGLWKMHPSTEKTILHDLSVWYSE